MKDGWEKLNCGDIITIKNNRKYKCVYVTNSHESPIKETDSVEIIEFFERNMKIYEITHDQFVNVDSKFENNFNYRFPVGSLVEIAGANKLGKTQYFIGTVVAFMPPTYRAYPESHRTKIHTFFEPVYDVIKL